ncbi:MAG: peptidylprolyl isomerase [Patescibacteria group bacterium]|mgnify:FL=1
MGKYFVYGGILVVLVIVLSGLKFTFPASKPEKKTETVENKTPPPAMELSKDKTYAALLRTTAGDITVSLYADKMPVTVNNFVALSRKKFYDNTIFHRIIKDFMIQGGDPDGNGSGGPGYQFNDELFEGEYTRGTLAMANRGPDTNGSQFFIIHNDTKLPKNYVIFGTVTKGIEVVDAIATAPTKQSANGESSTPVTPVTVTSVEIVEKAK